MAELDRKLLYGNTEALVLALLAERPDYGYQIQRELRHRSRHAIQFAFGRLYPMLHRMQRRGWVRSRRVKGVIGPERREYHLTREGRAELALRRRKWKAFYAAMHRILG